ncbi:MAG: hypothetical protein K0R38_6526 [Polyangiaceae bacterium]|jgi:hypothetical protein|nr:hypothetical protein [Polyangiaceae bacterium]
MAFSRALGVISIISVSWFAAVGCGDDDSNTQQPGAGGEGGEAGEGAGGTSLGGTTSGGAGNGGTSSAGESGNGTGGTAGDAGAGVGGQPVVGGAGGEPPVTPVGGAAGEGGAGGAGGQGPIAEASKQCGNECESDDDCFINANTLSSCDLVAKRCYDPSVVVCTTSADCIPPSNFWEECATTAECDDAALVCVTWQGAGYCATRNVDGCEFPASELALPEFGVPDAPVNVCVGLYGCRDGKCEPGCEQFGGCDGDLTCGEVSHLCECASAAQCPESGVCGADKLCAQCADSTDCPGGITGLDACVEGKCGCSAASACPDLTESATPVCE